MTGRPETIDLVGRAAERLDLGAALRIPADTWEDDEDEAPQARLEPTILAEVAAGNGGAPPPPASVMDTLADASAAASLHVKEPAAEIAEQTIALNWNVLGENGFVTLHNQNSLKAEEFRVIKRPLLRAAFGANHTSGTPVHKAAHLAMVTSPQPGDGKTFNAINLAISMAAERDLQVLLIDADLRNRGMSRTLGVSDRPGLAELLQQSEPSAQSVVLRTDMPSLSIIPAGQLVTGSTELLASRAMTRLVDSIASRYRNRFVIFDAPPVLASSEPGVLASHVGQVIMVVRANETSKRSIADALALVNTCPTVNFVLNQITRGAGPERYSYYGEQTAGHA